ncbi:dihydrofolate reductase family protein [Oceaniglobus trochenteri]|uniref:dihydrofolate reductase family protein n=1 Tax=Oceaniglobus trochenteri TaxID=2763260 RepID=UPI001CFF7E27|nr:dihydrofolate reductase family protein [Oceaniglobus trochenteri]
MRRIIYDVAVSLDGFICASDHDVSAFPAEGSHVTAYLERLAGYDTVIMGRTTYEFGYRFGLVPGARAYPHMDHHIFSRTLSVPPTADVTVVRDDQAGALRRLCAARGGDIYLCGGGILAGWVARQRLLSLLRIKRAPVVLGSGVTLFEGLAAPVRFTLIRSTAHDSGVIFSEYAVQGA